MNAHLCMCKCSLESCCQKSRGIGNRVQQQSPVLARQFKLVIFNFIHSLKNPRLFWLQQELKKCLSLFVHLMLAESFQSSDIREHTGTNQRAIKALKEHLERTQRAFMRAIRAIRKGSESNKKVIRE